MKTYTVYVLYDDKTWSTFNVQEENIDAASDVAHANLEGVMNVVRWWVGRG